MTTSIRSDASGTYGALQFNGEDAIRFDATGITQGIRESLASSASYAWAVNANPNLVLTTTGNLTLLAPTGMVQGNFYFLEIVYGGTHTVTWHGNFKGLVGLYLSSSAGARDALMFRAQSGTVLELVGVRLNVGA